MKVKDSMHKGVDWVSPDTPLTELALRGVSLQHCARIILNATSPLLNSPGLIRLQLRSLIAARPKMTQP